MNRETSTVCALARDEVRDLSVYAPDTIECAVDVSDNTNLWGAPPAVTRVLRATATDISRYPSTYSVRLNAAILRYLGLDTDDALRTVTGCGSDDVIDATMRAFASPGDRIAYSVPSFSMIPIFARLNSLDVTAIPLTRTWDVDAERLISCAAKVTYLCSPNNPTGTALSRDAVEHVAANARGIVLLDEAYAEFAPETFVDLVTRYERLVVTRTFSKAFGLAGLRVGYAVGHSDLVGMIERARGPYKVNAVGERAAIAALEESDMGIGWVREHAALAVANRDRFAIALRELDYQPLSSAANFIFVPHSRADRLARDLRSRGVQIRAFTGLPRDLPALERSGGMGFRIGVGPWSTMERVLDGLREVA